ncbi:TolC family protein [uncultured Desulfovibrio sp.]|uniref:TolC family protein n=1 Tax=uncultured Desulfovibrio sp. TaxID=167968 RepID=UPI0022018281|nr:TolC family protein [uncultured Desulfovibrio sp.]CAI3220995.1 hypothetical protein DWUX_342 [Desulfovibrio diazotrophicus]
MHMRYAALLFCFVWLWSTAAQADALTFTLKQAVDHAMEANPGVEAKQLILEQAKMNVGVAQSYFWPRLSLVAGTNRIENISPEQINYGSSDFSSYNWNKGFRASLSLFAGFAHLNNLEKSSLSVQVEKARHMQARLELGCNVQLQFLQLLKQREDLKSAKEALSRIQKQLDAAEAFVKVGMAPYVNVLQNKVELSRAQQQIIRVRNDIRNSEVQLNKYLGFPPDTPVSYAGDLKNFASTVGYTEERAIDTALRKRPDLVVAQKSVDVAYKDMHISMGGFLPRVDATYEDMSVSKDYDNASYGDYNRHYWSAGLNFSWEFFSGGGTTFDTLAQRKKAQSLQKDYEDAMSAARTEVIRSLLDIQAAKELIATTRIGVDAARESYGMANKRYMTNTGTITELLDAQLKLTQAETDASQALMEFHTARAKFYYYIGLENPGLN